MTVKFNRILGVVEVHVRAKFHEAKCTVQFVTTSRTVKITTRLCRWISHNVVWPPTISWSLSKFVVSCALPTEGECRQTDLQQLCSEWVSKVWRPARHITGHFRVGPPGNHLHWYGRQKLTAKSIKPTQKNPKYNNILPTYTCTQTQY